MNDKTTASGRILLIGSGDIGTRHLQAIATISEIREIEIVDPRPEGLRLGQERLKEVPHPNKAIHFSWHTSLEKASPEGALCIVATQAKGRRDIIKKVNQTLGYRAFFLEKIVTPSLDEYEDLLAMERRGIQFWINCKTRAFPFHQYAIARFDPSDSIEFSVTGGNHGLATNGVHSTDLFMFYDRSEGLELTEDNVDPVLHSSKRGGELFELSGKLSARSKKGSHFTLTFSKNNLASPVYLVSSPKYRFVLDQWARWAFEAESTNQWSWRPVPFEGNLDISSMSTDFVRDMLLEGHCKLPNLKDCYPAHAFILTSLQPHFNRLLGRISTFCPVT